MVVRPAPGLAPPCPHHHLPAGFGPLVRGSGRIFLREADGTALPRVQRIRFGVELPAVVHRFLAILNGLFFIKLSLFSLISRADHANDALSEHNISIHKRYAAGRKNRLAVLRAKIRRALFCLAWKVG